MMHPVQQKNLNEQAPDGAFSSGFLWGVTHIAPQVEGDCRVSDWSQCAVEGRVPEIGSACKYWEDYLAHHDLVEDLGCGALRISLEWARIEPQEGNFDVGAIEHYRKILRDLKERDITTVVGLFHWSVPAWFAERYGMHHKDACHAFVRYARHVLEHLGGDIDMLVIINEPMVYAGMGYIRGERPPFERSIWQGFCAVRTMVRAHRQVYALWKSVHPEVSVGSTYLWNDLRAASRWSIVRFAERLSYYWRVGYFVGRVRRFSDFIGVNYYTSDTLRFGTKDGKTGVHTTNDWHAPDVWHHFSDGFARVLREARRYHLPMYVLEHGKPSNPGVDDLDRQQLLEEHIEVIMSARSEGVDVRGYFHHSLMDCYEWDSGYDMKFGLIELAHDTLELRRRGSFGTYKKLINQPYE